MNRGGIAPVLMASHLLGCPLSDASGGRGPAAWQKIREVRLRMTFPALAARPGIAGLILLPVLALSAVWPDAAFAEAVSPARSRLHGRHPRGDPGPGRDH